MYIFEKNDCCGCMLCKEICPEKAISEVRIFGFPYPEVNQEKCIGCKKCIKYCPAINVMELKRSDITMQFEIASNKSLERIRKSSSGGVFVELASEIVHGGGYCIWGDF